MRRSVAILGIVALALLAASCRDEDLDGVVASAAREASRVEAAQLHAGAMFLAWVLTEASGVDPLSAATGFEVVVPRDLPEGIEVRWVIAVAPAAEPNGDVQPALVSVEMEARGRVGALQLLDVPEAESMSDAGEQVAVGDGFGTLTYPAGEGAGSLFSSLTFDGCGLRLSLTVFNLDSGPPFSAEEFIAVAEGTLAGCDGTDSPSAVGERYFLLNSEEVTSLDALKAHLSFDPVLPTYLSEGLMPSLILGQPLQPGAEGEPDGSALVVVYSGDRTNLLLTQGTGADQRSERGDDIRMAGARGRLLREGSDERGLQTTLAWEACALNFSLSASTFPGAPTETVQGDEELVRIAESIVEQCQR